jgi:serine phosphatase RsbU (regulator of sigma subunit)/tetratricopeptide (TPR) repeat protein
MFRLKYFIILFSFLLLGLFSFEQPSHLKDSLVIAYKNCNSDTAKISILIKIGRSYINSAEHEKILKIANVTLTLSQRINYPMGVAESNNLLAVVFYDHSEYDEALNHYNAALKIFKQLNNTQLISVNLIAIGNIYIKQAEYKKALNLLLESNKIIEEKLNSNPNDHSALESYSNSLNNTGNICFYMENLEQALEYYKKSYTIMLKLNQPANTANLLNNIGMIYRYQGKNDEALDYRQKALEIFKKVDNKEGMAYSYIGIGIIYFKLNNPEKAVEYQLKALETYEKLGSKSGMSMVYANLGDISLKFGWKDKAQLYYNKALKVAKEVNDFEVVMSVYNSLSAIYKEKKDYKSALENYMLFVKTKDTIEGESVQKQMAELQTKYDTEKKERKITILNKEKQLKDTEIKKQKIIIFSSLIGGIIFLLFFIIVLRLYNQKKISNRTLKRQNVEILQQKEEISTQRDEIEAQRDLVTMQKEHIEEIHKEVTDSINYARKIQEALLPVSVNARSVLGEHFILFKPKNIVSGDFYWTTKIHNLLFVAVADCTGHGVPGAFMSMLGISFLNEIAQKQEVAKANLVLNNLRKEVINALQQKGMQGEQKDGMDISLMILNTDTNESQWAGANNPLYIIRKSESEKLKSEELSTFNYRLDELKGDKMPIAIYPFMEEFANHEFVFEKGDVVYLFTDGYADQFGGPNGKKFMYRQFKELLLQNSQKPMNEQKELLETTLKEWIGKNKQVDDITIVGIKI